MPARPASATRGSHPGSSSSSRLLTCAATTSAGQAATSAAAAAPLEPQLGTPHFSDLPLDRAGSLRKDDAELQRRLADPSTRVLLLQQGKLLVAPATSAGTAALQPLSFAAAGAAAPGDIPPRWLPLVVSGSELAGQQQEQEQQGEGALLFLGLDAAGGAVFAACAPPQHLIDQLPPPPPPRGSSPAEQPAASSQSAVEGACWVDVRNAGQQMTGADAAVAALAVGLALWHGSANFCSKTGAPMVRAL